MNQTSEEIVEDVAYFEIGVTIYLVTVGPQMGQHLLVDAHRYHMLDRLRRLESTQLHQTSDQCHRRFEEPAAHQIGQAHRDWSLVVVAVVAFVMHNLAGRGRAAMNQLASPLDAAQ